MNSPALRPSIFFLRGALALAFAAACLLMPGATILALTFLVGVYFIADGISALFLKGGERSYGWTIATSVLSIVAGLVAFFLPVTTAVAIAWLTGAWAIALGITQIAGSLDVARHPRVSRGTRIFFGVAGAASIALGALILMQPWLGWVAIVTLLAVNALFVAAANFSLGFELRKEEKETLAERKAA